MFYFAWVDSTDTTFSESFKRNDETVFSVNISQDEGDFAGLEVQLVNPRVGLLAGSRKQWCWLSYNDTPLFFGRLVGVPQDMENNVVKLAFVARPADFEDQKKALAETLKVFPYWDPLFFSEEDAADPDKVLEARAALWHVDRTSGTVTISDINAGEDGRIDFTTGEVDYSSVHVTYSQAPARKVEVQASVNWAQVATGFIDVTPDLLRAYKEAGPPDGLFSVSQEPRPSEGTVNVANGQAMIDAWPKFGDQIGEGWSVGATECKCVGDVPLPPIFVPNYQEAWVQIQNWENFPNYREQLRYAFDRSPGFVVGIIDHTKDLEYPTLGGIPVTGIMIGGEFVHGDIDVLWVPVWQLAVSMQLNWATQRDRSETIVFAVGADTQPLLTDPDTAEVVRLTLDSIPVDDLIGDVKRNRYFDTDRGRQSLEHLLMRARAVLLGRARAVDVSFQVPFEVGLGVTCRKTASIADARLPGGGAAGKVKSYSIQAQDGARFVSVTISCSIGRGGSVTSIPGVGDYADDYVDGYQTYSGGQVALPTDDLAYNLPSYTIVDDGVNLASITAAEYLQNITVEGGLDQQVDAVVYDHVRHDALDANADSAVDAASKIANVVTKTKLVLKSVNGGPFDTNIEPDTVTALKVPKTIDLEA